MFEIRNTPNNRLDDSAANNQKRTKNVVQLQFSLVAFVLRTSDVHRRTKYIPSTVLSDGFTPRRRHLTRFSDLVDQRHTAW